VLSSLRYDEFGFPTSQSVITTAAAESAVSALNRSVGRSTTYVSVRSASRGQGASESLEPILELLPGAVHGLENVRHMAVARLRDISPRHAVVKGSATPSFDIETYPITTPVVTDRMIETFTQHVFDASPYTVPSDEARRMLQHHQRQLFHDARTFSGGYAAHPLLDAADDDDGLG
jgi:hypothetical protein